MIRGIKRLAAMVTALFIMGVSTNAFAVYYNYSTWNPGKGSVYGVDGWVGTDGIDRIVFYDTTNTAYIYQVTTSGDPDLHPLNPDATGPIAPRSFMFESQFALQNSNYSHENEFYVDVANGYFYLGATNGIEQYDFSGAYQTTIGTPSPNESGYSTQSLGYNPVLNDWYAATIGFDSTSNVFVLDGDNLGLGWVEIFDTPVSNHHDGLEVLSNGNLLLADYNGTIDEYTVGGTYVMTHTHDPFPTELEGMGYGALGHYWGGSHTGVIFEFGGGTLSVPEPATALLFGSGLFGLAYLRRRQTRSKI